MKETGIIMSGNHPKLILDGIKTQTRRTNRLDRVNWHPDGYTMDLQGDIAAFRYKLTGADVLIRCPYGQVGDRLWVRETHNLDLWDERNVIQYKADWLEWLDTKPKDFEPSPIKWRPSIFMPRWASRITLEITEVRVERVQEITGEDAGKEGIGWDDKAIRSIPQDELETYLVYHFSFLWDSLNAKRGYGWEANPWVWVISFKVVEK